VQLHFFKDRGRRFLPIAASAAASAAAFYFSSYVAVGLQAAADFNLKSKAQALAAV